MTRQQKTANDMYRGSSPIFDVPEFPALRRVKPLPKRRRTSDQSVPEDVNTILPGPPPALLDPDVTAEELLASADSFSAQMALQSYYMPILGGMQELFRSDLEGRTSGPIDFGTAGYGIREGQTGEQEEEDRGEGDYIDHLTQPGNTKKRKVPANVSASPHGHDTGDNGEGGEDEPTERSIPTGGRPDQEPIDIVPPPSPSGTPGQRKGKISAATLAGLQHKEMLKSRKRQLAAVLGALSHGDTLALDQALSATYSFVGTGISGDLKRSQPIRMRLSRRRGPRLRRSLRAIRKALPSSDQLPIQVAFPECNFSFVYHSPTSDRLIATKEEVAVLRSRFEAELARQASNAAKAAAFSKLAASVPSKGARSKRADRALQRARTSGVPDGKGSDQAAEFLDHTLAGTKPRGGKKKKRSALANASNPHHLKNYVPSRLPHSGQGTTNQAPTNLPSYLGPPPLRFLSAEIPPRRRKNLQATPTAQLTNPADEWICPFCEYELFYGNDPSYRRAIRSRKKILRRRRRARERAAAAASGTSTAKVPEKNGSNYDDYDTEFEPSVSSGAKSTKWKGDVAEGRGGDHLDHSFG